MGGGGMVRAIGKIGKRLCFPSAPSSWVSATVYEIQRYQDRRPKSEVLFPFHYPKDNRDRDRDRTKDEDEGGTYTCPSMRPVSNKEYHFCQYYDTVSEFLQSQSEYDDLAACTTTIQIGNQFDVVSLLDIGFDNNTNTDNNTQLFRLNGDTVELQHLRGKNVLVFCVHVPVYWDSMDAARIRALPLACTGLFSGNNNNNNYEAVIVPRMRRDWATDRDAFDHFLSGFPSSWLAIPFSHPLRRNSICNSLGLTSYSGFMCLFVDQTQKVLHHGPCFNRYLSHYEIHSSNIRYAPPWWENCQLHTMLGCNPSDYVYKLNPAPAPGISISELNNKLVGLYMCKDGSFIRTLSLVHQECKSKGMDFEIVLIYLPVLHEAINPQLFQDAVNHVILQDLKIDSWWVLPYDDRRHQRFKHNRKTFADDELFIVGPHNEFVEPYGRQVIYRFGFNAYPFSFEHVVEKRFQEIRGLTLDCLLGDYEVTAQGLRGKIVLLYMDSAHSLNYALYSPLLEWYYTIKRTRNLSSDSDFEVVFVDLLGQYGDAPLHMPWRRCSFDPQHAAFLTDSLGIAECGGIVAFGKDARILTLYAQHLLQSCDLDVIQSYKGLRNDVYKNVQLDYVVNQTFDD